jgi:hypothetical protein
MLKFAYELGIKLAYDEEGATPAQIAAAQRLGAVGGGVLGAGAGGLLGKSVGTPLLQQLGIDDEEKARALATGIGSLLGAGAGGYAGYQAPKALMSRRQKPEESSLGVLPVAQEAPYGEYEEPEYSGEYMQQLLPYLYGE